MRATHSVVLIGPGGESDQLYGDWGTAPTCSIGSEGARATSSIGTEGQERPGLLMDTEWGHFFLIIRALACRAKQGSLGVSVLQRLD